MAPRDKAGRNRQAGQPGAARLRAVLRRLAQAQRAAWRGQWPGTGSLAGPPLAPPPETEWERAAESRLRRIEQQLANQNRMLMLTFVSIVADMLLGLR